MTRVVYGPPERNAILGAIVDQAPRNMELRPDGTEDPLAAAYVEGVRAAWEAARAVLLGERPPVSSDPLPPEEDSTARRDAIERRWLEQTISDIAYAIDLAREVDSAVIHVDLLQSLLRRPR